MKPHDDPHEQDLIQHYRQHGQGEPGAALDARILAAAHQAVKHPGQGGAPVRSLWQRLFAPSGLAALAGVACLGLALSLSWRSGLLDRGDPDARYGVPATREQPQAMAPAASPVSPSAAAYEMASDAAKREAFEAAKKKRANEAVRQSRLAGVSGGSLAEEVPLPATAQSQADAAPALDAVSPEMASQADVSVEDDLREQLLRLRELRAQGRADEARALEAELRRRYPRLELEDELKRLAP